VILKVIEKENGMKRSIFAILVAIFALAGSAYAQKTYKHAAQYQVATLDQNLRVETGTDATLAKTQTDSKLGAGGQGIHLLHTDAGNYRVEAPVNQARTILMARGRIPTIMHNQWFLDDVHAGTKVLFASECSKPNKKHPNDVASCHFWFPDPDSATHEYETRGDFTPHRVGDGGDGSNVQKTANALCGTGKLKPETEAQICNQ
jgi:hypothetical protein